MKLEKTELKNFIAIKLDQTKNLEDDEFVAEEDQEFHEISFTESQIDKPERVSKVNYDQHVLTNPDNDLSSDEDEYEVLEKPPYHHIIIDCSPLNYIDTFSVKTIHQVSFIKMLQSIKRITTLII